MGALRRAENPDVSSSGARASCPRTRVGVLMAPVPPPIRIEEAIRVLTLGSTPHTIGFASNGPLRPFRLCESAVAQPPEHVNPMCGHLLLVDHPQGSIRLGSRSGGADRHTGGVRGTLQLVLELVAGVVVLGKDLAVDA